jgi:hypothetical protein
MSMLMTPVVRGACTCVPGQFATAAQAGTGKSYLLDCVAAIAIAGYMPVLDMEKNVEENRKRLETALIQGQMLFSMDNTEIPLGGPWLCQAIERPQVEPRWLQHNKAVALYNNWSLFGSGNNLKLLDDVVRRCLKCTIKAGGRENPLERTFKSKPFDRALAQRWKYIRAILTIARAYIEAGCPGELRGIGEPFTEWNRFVRSALVWVGFADPVESQEGIRSADPRRQQRLALWTAIAGAYGYGLENRRSCADVIHNAERGVITKRKERLADWPPADPKDYRAVALRDALEVTVSTYSGKLKPQWLGNHFGQFENTVTGELMLKSDYNKKESVNYWYLERVEHE